MARCKNARGFTLIELLVTVIILGILASIAVNLVDAKEAAYKATVQSDIRNMIFAQYSFFDDNAKFYYDGGSYTSARGQLTYQLSPGVTMNMVGQDNGFTVRLRHENVPGYQCAVYVGTITPIFSPATEEGVVACSDGGGGGGSSSSGSGPKGGK